MFLSLLGMWLFFILLDILFWLRLLFFCYLGFIPVLFLPCLSSFVIIIIIIIIIIFFFFFFFFFFFLVFFQKCSKIAGKWPFGGLCRDQKDKSRGRPKELIHLHVLLFFLYFLFPSACCWSVSYFPSSSFCPLGSGHRLLCSSSLLYLLMSFIFVFFCCVFYNMVIVLLFLVSFLVLSFCFVFVYFISSFWFSLLLRFCGFLL